MLETTIGQTIARMFGTISYNKPNFEDFGDGKSINEYESFYNSGSLSADSSMRELAMLLQTNLSEILGITGTGGIRDNGRMYQNTFWLINNKIIPSSEIIEQLINSIRGLPMTQVVDFDVDLKEIKTTPIWSDPTDFSDLAMANRWRIDYSTRFNLTNLLNIAAQKA
jgi:hypothetical protein